MNSDAIKMAVEKLKLSMMDLGEAVDELLTLLGAEHGQKEPAGAEEGEANRPADAESSDTEPLSKKVKKLWEYAADRGLSPDKWKGIAMALGVKSSNVNEQQWQALRREVLVAIGVRP